MPSFEFFGRGIDSRGWTIAVLLAAGPAAVQSSGFEPRTHATRETMVADFLG